LISKQTNGIINIGTGEGISVEKISRMIANLINREDLLKFQSSSDTKSFVVSDPRKLLGIIGQYPWTNLEQALLETIKSRREIVLGK
jgi:UDP-glucose 4-epimerase